MRSELLGLSGLGLLALIGLVLALVRDPGGSSEDQRRSLARLFLIGVAFQCCHLTEELLTGFAVRFPGLFGLEPWSDRFFVTFNLFWIATWILCAAVLPRGPRIAFFPIWFFALGMTANAIAHPLIAIAVGGYFPGLVTAFGTGPFGVLILRRLVRMTRATS